MNEEIVKALAQGGVLGLVLGLVVLYQGKAIAQLGGEIRELIGLLRERFKIMGLICLLALCLVAGCQSTWEVCIVDPEYGRICASRVEGKWKITAEVELPPEVRNRIEESLEKLRK